MEDIYLLLHARTRNQATKATLQEFFATFPYIYSKDKWQLKENCVWEEYSFLESSMVFLSREYHPTFGY